MNPGTRAENSFMEIDLHSLKGFISGSYNPHVNLIKNKIQDISEGFNYYSSKYFVRGL